MAFTDRSDAASIAQGTASDQAAARIRELNERLLESALAAGSKTVDAYERALQNLAQVASKPGGATPLDWLNAIAHAQAGFVRDVSNAYTAALRVLLD